MTTTAKGTIVLKVEGGKDINLTIKQIRALKRELSGVSTTSKTGAAELDKMNKGVAGSRNPTTDFAKQAQGLGGLVHVYATVAANVFALSAAFSVLKSNADLTIMKQSAEDLSISTGISYTAIATNMNKITSGAISLHEAMRSANLALSGGATSSQVAQITTIANKAANTLGVSVPNAVNRMIQAVTKGEPELVDELGIILRVTRATEDYAFMLNKTVTELTTFEKQQAIINQLITQGNAKFADVANQANPYEVLAASVSNLSKTIISLVSGPLSSIVSIFSKSNVLLGLGIGILVNSIVKRAIPEISKLGDIWIQKAAAGADVAAEAVQKYEDSIISAREELRVLANTQQVSADTHGDLAKDLIATEIQPNLGNSKNLKKQFKGIMGKNLVGAAFIQELKTSGIDQELAKLVEKGLKKAPLQKFEKKLLDNHGEAIGILLEHIEQSNETVVASINETKANAKVTAAKITSLRSEIQTSFLRGVGSIFNASGRGVIEAYKTSMASLRTQYTALIAQQSTFASGLSIVSMRARQAGLSLAVLGRGLVGLFGKFTKLTGILFTFQAVLEIFRSIGLMSNKLGEAKDAISQNIDELESANEKYSDFNEIMKTIPKGISEATNKWSKLANITDQYNTILVNLVDTISGLQSATALDKFISWVTFGDDAEKAAKGIIDVVKNTQSKLIAPISIPIKLNSEILTNEIASIQRRLTEMAKNKERLDGGEDQRGKAKIGEFRSAEELSLKNQLIKAEQKLAKVRTEVFILSENASVQELTALIENKGISTKELLKGADELKKKNKPFREFQNIIKEIGDAVTATDRKLGLLRAKSEARRVFNVDSYIGFRDDLVKVRKGVNAATQSSTGVKDGQKLVNDAIAQLTGRIIKGKGVVEGYSAAMKAAFNLEGLKPGVSADKAEAILSGAITDFDRVINTIRNYKNELALLAEEEKAFKRDQKAGAFIFEEIYENKGATLRETIKALSAEVISKRTLIASLGKTSNDLPKNNLDLKVLKSRLKTEEEILNLHIREAKVPGLEKDIGKNARLQAELKITLSIQKALEASSKKTNMEFMQSASAKLKALALQRKNGDSLNASIIENSKLTSFGLRKELAIAEITQTKRNQKEAQLKLDKSELDTQYLKLEYMKEELRIIRSIRETKAQQSKEVGGPDTGFLSSFNYNAVDDLSTDFKHLMFKAAADLGSALATPVETLRDTFITGINSVTSNLVDALMNNEWDGKEEGHSMATAIREGLKDDLRDTLGATIKDNMTHAITNLAAELNIIEGNKIADIIKQQGVIQSNTVALHSLATALALSNVKGSSISSPLKALSLDLFTPGTVPATTTSLKPLASGGIVHGATNALIGEGANSEAVVPLPDNRSIPVTLEGSSGGSVEVHQTFDFRGADASTEQKLRQMAMQIKQETIQAITYDINRGGKLAKVVGRR